MSFIEFVSALAIPLVLLCVALVMLGSKKQYFDLFTSGAKDGLLTCVNLLPTLIALMAAVKMFNASGAVELINRYIAPLFQKIGVPSEILPLLITRPISGSASNASFFALIKEYGADSFPALCAAVIMGSSDTVIYITAVYFSSVGIKKSRHTFPTAFFVMIFCIFFSCFVCRWFFG